MKRSYSRKNLLLKSRRSKRIIKKGGSSIDEQILALMKEMKTDMIHTLQKDHNVKNLQGKLDKSGIKKRLLTHFINTQEPVKNYCKREIFNLGKYKSIDDITDNILMSVIDNSPPDVINKLWNDIFPSYPEIKSMLDNDPELHKIVKELSTPIMLNIWFKFKPKLVNIITLNHLSLRNQTCDDDINCYDAYNNMITELEKKYTLGEAI